MTILVKHVFQSAKADGPDSTIVQPSDWNDTHNITLAAGKVMGRDTSAAGAVQELPLSFDSTLQSMVPPSGTTAQRPSVPVAGMLRYNTTLAQFEIYRNGAWQPVGSSAYYNAVSPTNPKAGDLWYDSVGGLLMTYTGSAWVAAVVTSAVGLSVIQASTQAAARAALGVTIGTDVQAYSSNLSAVAGLATTGLIANTGTGTAVTRAVTSGTGITVANGDGVSGNPTIAVDGDTTLTSSTTKVPFSSAVKTYVDGLAVFTKSYTSAQQTLTTAGALTLAHGMGIAPKILRFTIVCQTAEFGYSVNDEVEVSVNASNAGTTRNHSVVCDATNINVRYCGDTTLFIIGHKTTGAASFITSASWKFVVRAFA
jgi:hypothetical protein